MKNRTYNKKKILVVFICAALILFGLIGRLVWLMIFDAEYYQELAQDLHEREREIKAARGEIVDRNGVYHIRDPQPDRRCGSCNRGAVLGTGS